VKQRPNKSKAESKPERKKPPGQKPHGEPPVPLSPLRNWLSRFVGLIALPATAIVPKAGLEVVSGVPAIPHKHAVALLTGCD
jgi:hypothetical protein